MMFHVGIFLNDCGFGQSQTHLTREAIHECLKGDLYVGTLLCIVSSESTDELDRKVEERIATLRTSKYRDVDGKPYVYGDRMSKRQFYSHGGAGWDYRFYQPEYSFETDQVENDEPEDK